MIDFYNCRINENITNNTWYQLDDKHYFKMPISFNEYTNGSQLRVHNIDTGKTAPEYGYFLPNTVSEYFITDFSNNSIELITQLYTVYDIYTMENQLLKTQYFFRIPWYHIPKNFLDYQPKHLIMMFNMGYLMQDNPNNAQSNNMYYNKYYHGIEVSQNDIEQMYTEYVVEKFSMENIIVRDYLNL